MVKRWDIHTVPFIRFYQYFDEYSDLLEKAITVIASQFAKKSTGNLFAGRSGKLTDSSKQIRHTDDFELITWLVIKKTTET